MNRFDWARLALQYADDTKHREKIDMLLRMVHQKPNDVQILNQLGQTYQVRQFYIEAQTAYRKALAIKPDSADTWENLGWLHDHSRDSRVEAVAAFEKAVKLDPRRADVWERLHVFYTVTCRSPDAADALRRVGELKSGAVSGE